MSKLNECVQRIEEIKGAFHEDTASAALNSRAVEDLKVKGLVTALMETLKEVSKEDKPAAFTAA